MTRRGARRAAGTRRVLPLLVLAPVATWISLKHAALFRIAVVPLMERGSGEHLGCDDSSECECQGDLFRHRHSPLVEAEIGFCSARPNESRDYFCRCGLLVKICVAPQPE